MSNSPLTNVIDNKKVHLLEQLERILPKTSNAKIAVGYFFISGFAGIIKPLKDVNKIQLLISNTTDKTTADALIEGFRSIKEVRTEIDDKNFVNKKRKEQVLLDSEENVKKSLEHMSQSVDDLTVVENLIEWMKAGKLVVRVYPKEKLHAKAYIFKNKDTRDDSWGIVGSSNLSMAGLSTSSELNLKTRSGPDIQQLIEWFDGLWKDGLEFTKEFNIILENSWAGKTYSPYQLYLKAAYHEVKEKLEGQHEFDPVWSAALPKLFDFQSQAVDYGLTMFELHGGVIIGDVVGLGKTYIGIALLKYLQIRGKQTMIICPPHLIPMWERICVDFEVKADIKSRGELSSQDYELYQDYKFQFVDVVLIDESHNFRNKASRQYENLAQFMRQREAKGILLTATPYANRPTDIKNQIMLFHQSEKTSIPPANETDIDSYFRAVKRGDENLVDLLRNIMIRRTRRYILNQWGKTDDSDPTRPYLLVGKEKKYFPKRDMKTVRYDINKVYQRKYDSIVELLDKEHLHFARYSTGKYLKKEFQDIPLYQELSRMGNLLVPIIKFSLLKRMESSLQAFRGSIENYINTHRVFLNFLDDGIIPVGDFSNKAMYDLALNDPDFIDDKETLEKLGQQIKESTGVKYDIKAFDVEKLKSDTQKDLEVFEHISGLIQRITYKTDDKLHTLQRLLDNDYKNKKVLIFTEFATTAKYLDANLKWTKGKKRQVDGSTGRSMQEVVRRFDPVNNPTLEKKITKEEEISLLISTDVLSEGQNLQAGQVIINYDFHWNPIRLIQRAGRIDRIGSEHDTITVHNFLPDPKIEEDLGLETTVSHKIDEIQRVIGEDYKILKEDETVNEEDTYAIARMDESILDREDKSLEPSEFEKILNDLKVNDAKFWEEFKKIPDGIRSSSKDSSSGRLLMACESGSLRSGRLRKYYLIDSKKQLKAIASNDAMKLLKSEDRSTYPTPKNYDSLVEVGWKKFLQELEDKRASEISAPTLTGPQRWIIEKLLKMSKSSKMDDEKEQIEKLRQAFSLPIFGSRLKNELSRLKKVEPDDAELVKTLSAFYINFQMKKEAQEDEEQAVPRILYSKFLAE